MSKRSLKLPRGTYEGYQDGLCIFRVALAEVVRARKLGWYMLAPAGDGYVVVGKANVPRDAVSRGGRR